MKYALRTVLFVFSLAVFVGQAQISQFQHIIVVFQENRTPDNLFYMLCANYPCSTAPDNPVQHPDRQLARQYFAEWSNAAQRDYAFAPGPLQACP